MKKVLVTCPPMLRARPAWEAAMKARNLEPVCPEVRQILTEDELIALLPDVDGWIIGDDPATARVVRAGRDGRLRAAVKWGVGVDNVDFTGFRAAGVPVINTPGMFGREVADLAMGYVVALARRFVEIDRGVRDGKWTKPAGISLAGKRVALVGFGDIGRNTARRLLASEMLVTVYDPYFKPAAGLDVESKTWPEGIEEADFLVLTCALTPANHHMVNDDVFRRCRPGLHVVNVARGPLVDEDSLIAALRDGRVTAAALDVFEMEPLPEKSPLRDFPQCVFGSHNGSNTRDAVERTSLRAIELLSDFLKNT